MHRRKMIVETNVTVTDEIPLEMECGQAAFWDEMMVKTYKRLNPDCPDFIARVIVRSMKKKPAAPQPRQEGAPA